MRGSTTTSDAEPSGKLFAVVVSIIVAAGLFARFPQEMDGAIDFYADGAANVGDSLTGGSPAGGEFASPNDSRGR